MSDNLTKRSETTALGPNIKLGIREPHAGITTTNAMGSKKSSITQTIAFENEVNKH